MNRSAIYLVALSLIASPLACKKKDDAAAKSKSSAKDESADDDGDKKKKKKASKTDDEPEGEPESDDKPKAKATKGCKAPANVHVEADWTIPEGCKLTLKENIELEKGATLTIEPGATLKFEADKYLWVRYGKIVAKGTEDKPIVFTSANSSPGAGDWEGIVFETQTMAGNVFDHVTVEYAGHGGYGKAAINVYGEINPGRITITNSIFQHNSHGAIENDKPKSKFAKVEGNTFKENGGASLILDPDVIGSVGQNKFEEPILLKQGIITSSQTWPKAPAYILEDNLSIQGKGSAAIVTIPEKSTVKVAVGKYIWVGGADGGGIVAKGVTFTSSNGSPSEGDWEGIVLDTKAVSSAFEDCTFEYAGHGGYGKGAVNFYGDTPSKLKGIKIKNCTFRHNSHGGISTHGEKDCGDLGKENKSEGKPICLAN
jgi:hypothetical protein